MEIARQVLHNPLDISNPTGDRIHTIRLLLLVGLAIALVARAGWILVLTLVGLAAIKLLPPQPGGGGGGGGGLVMGGNGIEQFDAQPIDQSAFRTPAPSNPFMNYQLDEITNNPTTNKPDGFAQNNHIVRPEMETTFKLGGVHVDNEGDIWGRKFSSLAFYTIPGNSPVRDPDGTFQNWLYGSVYPTCREDVRFCAVKPPRTEVPNENGILDRTVGFSIGLDRNTARRVAAGLERGN